MGILVQKAGVLDTIQDLGRNGFRKFGINPNGVMDRNALRLINILLGNTENQSAIEMHFPASEFVFNEEAIFTLGGADFTATLNKNPLDLLRVHYAKKGDLLKFSRKRRGNRCYLGVNGGFEVENWLNSSSTNLIAKVGGKEGRTLQKGDEIVFNTAQTTKGAAGNLQVAGNLRPEIETQVRLRLTPGAEYRRLTGISEQNFLEKTFRITQDSNRMGYKLEGTPLHLLNTSEVLSSAVNFGTIQLLPNGQMVVLMADHQTTGGYPRIGHIIETDLSKLAQCGPGDEVGFDLVSLAEAERCRADYERDLSFLRVGVRFHSGKL